MPPTPLCRVRRRRPYTVALTLAALLAAGCDDAGHDETDAAGSSGDAGPGGGGQDAGPGGGAVDGGPRGEVICGETPLTEWEQKMLEAHNRWRAAVEPAAAEMYRVHWDRQIAENAARWVASCDPDWPHSPEQDRSGVGGYDVLGENLSYCAGTGCDEDPSVTDGSGMGDGEGWWAERTDYRHQDDSSTGVVSHYLQLASSNVYAIGCATQRCSAPGPFGWAGEWWWTICQYGPRGQGYWNGTRPYEAGEGGLVEPPASVYDAHPGLCRPTE